MKLKYITAVFILFFSSTMCLQPKQVEFGTLIPPLKNSAWDNSQWISVVDAPVVEETIRDGMRAADGANWFLSEITNTKDVVSAKWMTTALGVFELYLNEKLVGNEILKPGFTHHDKTKISFTYDLTAEFKKKEQEINQLSVQVTPGWWGG